MYYPSEHRASTERARLYYIRHVAFIFINKNVLARCSLGARSQGTIYIINRGKCWPGVIHPCALTAITFEPLVRFQKSWAFWNALELGYMMVSKKKIFDKIPYPPRALSNSVPVLNYFCLVNFSKMCLLEVMVVAIIVPLSNMTHI